MKDENFLNQVSNDRIASRQVDELIGIARGLCADGAINQSEGLFLQKWLAANVVISDQPLIRILYDRIRQVFSDGNLSDDEALELFETLNSFGNGDFELGETLKSTTLPLCDPPPSVEFQGKRFTFTGTFNFGQRRECERAAAERGADCGTLTQSTSFLVIGVYATESWKHSSMGTKIEKACELRDRGFPISIISEEHWTKYL